MLILLQACTVLYWVHGVSDVYISAGCYIRRASISVDCWVDHPLGQGVEALNLDQSVKTNFQEQKKLSAPRLKRGAGTLTLHGRPTRTSVIQTILEANLFQSQRLRQLGWVQGFTIYCNILQYMNFNFWHLFLLSLKVISPCVKNHFHFLSQDFLLPRYKNRVVIYNSVHSSGQAFVIPWGHTDEKYYI